MIKLIVFDIDGVLTNGMYTIDSAGNESKTISFKDLDSFNLLKNMKIKTMLLTSECNSLSKYFAKKFNPDIFFDGIKDKYNKLKDYIENNDLDFSNVCYVGDGKKDIECIENCGFSICPVNAIDEIKQKSKVVLNISGGSGVVYEVYKIIKSIESSNINSIIFNIKDDFSDFNKVLNHHTDIIGKIKEDSFFNSNLTKAVNIMIDSLKNNCKILSCGNGGSASDSQHFVAELISKFKFDRISIPAISLTTNTSILTSIGNDYSFDRIFSRQIEGLGNINDVLFAITTSGNSENINLAIDEAKKKKMKIILLTSEKCINEDNDIIILKVPCKETERIQEFHIMMIHYICNKIESEFINEK